ncbi:O-linked N-acetylglucosamine transferase, SPINDLY family protein [Rhizobium herbae]
MSASLSKALGYYNAMDYDKALSLLSPARRQPFAVNELLLIAQCYAKTGKFAEAGAFYIKAAELGGPKQAMLRALAANMLQEADDSFVSLNIARLAAKSGIFDTNAEETYRRYLHEFLCLDEALMDDQRFLDRLKAGDERYLAAEFPHRHIGWCGDESINARQTKVHGAAAFTQVSRAARRAVPHRFSDRVRVGYLSADFSDQHATMRLFQSALLQHDQERFDIALFCNTEDDLIKLDRGSRNTYPNLQRIGHLTDQDAAALIRSAGIDILVDLKGHTKGSRAGLLNHGAAPIQVAYLGFPGSGTGIDCDYVITDAIVTPEASRPFYHEKFCLLPDSYQANDNVSRPLPPATPRSALGLPEDRIVFASFNAHRKIKPVTAQIWADILRRTDDSILWVMCANRFARENLVRWMEKAGIASDRIIFADPAAYPDHIARLQAADIGLDTFPCNGHTTTSDKLWAGLPVPTCKGTHFASRVTESLLHALGAGELVADNPELYVELCVSLAKNPDKLRAAKDKVAAQRTVAPLFDTTRFIRHLEKAFEMMIERARNGQEPDHIAVPAIA